jgi:hypothetical protein
MDLLPFTLWPQIFERDYLRFGFHVVGSAFSTSLCIMNSMPVAALPLKSMMLAV